MKTTKQDFEKYKGFCLEWQRELGLDDWHIYFEHRKVDGAFATTHYKVSERVANIWLATAWDGRPVNDEELRQNALHEVLHLVTAPLLAEADSRHTTQLDIDSAEHGIVVRLTNYITRIKT